MIWQDSILNFMPEVLKCSLTLSICISDRTEQRHMGLWSVKLVGGKDAWAPRGPPACPTCAQIPVFTPALPLTPSFCPLVFGASGCQPIDRVCFCPMFVSCSEPVTLLWAFDLFKEAPRLWDNPLSPHFLLDARPVHASPLVCEGISPVSPTARLGSQRASSRPHGTGDSHPWAVQPSPGLKLHLQRSGPWGWAQLWSSPESHQQAAWCLWCQRSHWAPFQNRRAEAGVWDTRHGEPASCSTSAHLEDVLEI